MMQYPCQKITQKDFLHSSLEPLSCAIHMGRVYICMYFHIYVNIYAYVVAYNLAHGSVLQARGIRQQPAVVWKHL